MFLFSAVSDGLHSGCNRVHQSTSQKQFRNLMIKKQKRNIRGGGAVWFDTQSGDLIFQRTVRQSVPWVPEAFHARFPVSVRS